MLTQTKYFGEIEYDTDDVLQFDTGLFGFEEEQCFLLLPFAESNASLLCLQSLATPGLAFVLMDPFSLTPHYTPLLQAEELTTLSVTQSEDLCYYVLCVVGHPVSTSTINLKCPVVLNPETRHCMQVILEGDTYHMRHPLSEFGTEGAESVC